jgi:prolipoprotein diacylglyceryltransferase
MAWLIRRARAAGRRLPPGFLAGLFLTWYAVARFLTDTLRTYDERMLGLTGAQWGMLAVLPLGIWVLATAHRRRATPEPSEDREPATV